MLTREQRDDLMAGGADFYRDRRCDSPEMRAVDMQGYCYDLAQCSVSERDAEAGADYVYEGMLKAEAEYDNG